MEKTDYKKGTTTIGLVCKDGIILAADKRGSMGHLTMHKGVDKVLKLTDYIGITTAGMVADAHKLYEYLKSELQLYILDKEEEPTVEVATKLISNILYGGRQSFLPYMSIFILGGKSEDGDFKVFSLDTAGSALHDKYICSGSGMELAYGVLESSYKEGMSIEEGKKLAARTINTALKRDIYTGDGIDIVVVDKSGYKKIKKEEIDKLLKNN